VLRPVRVPAQAIVELVMLPATEVAARMAGERGLLGARRG
jgi:hypothetical protein